MRRKLRSALRRIRGKTDQNERHDRFVQALKGHYRCETVIDVGVGHGTPWLYASFPDAFHVLVEPVIEFQPDIQAILSQHRGQHVTVAAGPREESLTMNVEPRRRTRSSFLARTELTRTGDELEQREIDRRPLDALSREHGWAAPFGLKVDVEGDELGVLKGAEQVLAESAFVIVEASLADRFHGGAGLGELSSFMHRQGFMLSDLLHVAYTREQPRRPQRADLLFVPTPDEA